MPLPRPPSADPLVALADQCVQCGLCLPPCPTYRRERIESESPRGRIALARSWALDALEPTAAGDTHLDNCLGCRACEAVCPAGVRYGALLVAARGRQRERRPPALRQRVVEALAVRPRVLNGLLGAYRRVYPLLPAALRWLPRPPRGPGRAATASLTLAATTPPPKPAVAPAGAAATRATHPVDAALRTGHSAADPADTAGRRPLATPVPVARPDRVAIFVGCAARRYEATTRVALARLLAACGIALDIPPAQGCCGALHAHAGDAATAGALAAANARAFDGVSHILTLASGCHASVAVGAPAQTTVVDALEFLDARSDALGFRALDRRIGVHLPCTQRNVVRSVPALRRLLSRVPGAAFVDLDDGFGCCGASGSALLVEPGRADAFRRPLVEQIERSTVDLVLSANIGCRLHLQNGTAVPVMHPIEFLAAQLDVDATPAA